MISVQYMKSHDRHKAKSEYKYASNQCIEGKNGISLKGHRAIIFILTVLSVFLFGSCSNLRYLEENQSLYTGSEVNINSETPVQNESELRSELETVIIPDPNSKILIWRPRLWMYNVAGDGEGFIGKWLKNSIGRPPILIEDVDADRTAGLMENRLFNMGHFDAEVDYDLKEKKKRTSVDYQVDLNAPYLIRNIFLIEGNSTIAQDINRSMEESELQRSQVYRLDRLTAERERIDTYLKEIGYYYFHPDFLLFRADSTAGNREVNLQLTIKPNAPDYALEKYRILHVHVDAGYALDSLDGSHTETDDENKIADGVYVEPDARILKARSLNRAIFLEKDSIYRNSDHRQTIRHLTGMGIFKFVNIRFERMQSDEGNFLDVRINLTPMEKRTISTELSGVTKSNNFAGPGLTASLTNRNFLRGAENLTINLEGSFESLLGQRGVNSTEVGISSVLSIPRLITPYKIGRVSPRFIPKTNFELAYSYLFRTDAFSLSSYRAQFGYLWKPVQVVEHRLDPFVFNAFSLGTISPEFEDVFSREVLLRRGLFEQFLIGSEYSFLYNSQLESREKHDWFFNFNLDFSGNLAWLLSDLFNAPKSDNGNYEILNQSFAQFTRSYFDLRYYNNMGTDSRIATRLIAGIGVPYGNSGSLPYTKLFVTGGSNSIRAFHPRNLGPGAYPPPDSLGTSLNIYQSGEIKLEMNLEYRFGISSIIKGAVFADAGNIWNLEENEDTPGGMFRSDEFLSQLAIGTGFGLRFDFTFFLLRLDLAFPVAIPYTESYFETIRPFDSQWRRDNLILNLAIGYPF